ncbi:hypothetical protein BG015_011399 [Linnemannia schmuckeri]|uniref:IMD domain-containing protein n=1 Tax=Linnemannia schmuckeri TaxID=64567 RepID=A0A9P5VEG3_9FUNG|nr:hypothetical protein BG015_011399 [Linnemannia schmuckeri]
MLSTVSLIDPTTLNPSFSGPDTSRMGRPAVIITRADQQTAVDQFQLLLTNAKAYRLQMLALSKAAASFGYALEKIAHSKASVRDPTNVCSSLQAAAGLHYLMSNHHQILSDTLYKQFEIPLLQHLDTHKANIEASEAQYERSMRDMSQKIKETEATSLQNGRKRQRDLLQFRQALTTLTMQVDELERIKLGYYFSNLESEQANLQLILQKTSTIVRAEVDIYERIANKGLNDTILEPMTTQGPDPYCTYATTDEFSSIFSILPPTPIIPTGAAGGSGSTGTSTPQPDPIMTTFYGYHEANPFSTARNQTGTRDRHLFGEASSVDSKESMMEKAATIVVPAAIGSGVAGAKAPAAGATITATTTSSTMVAETKTKDVASTSTAAAATTQDSTNSSSQTSALTITASKDTKGASSEKTVQALAIVEEEKSTSGNKIFSKATATFELANGRAEEETVSNNNGDGNNSSSQENGVNMRRGQQHHRHRTFSKQSEDNASSTAAVSGATAATAVSAAPASSPTTSDRASSIPSYSLRSRSGSRSHLLLASTPDSPPVRGMIHIAGDSELLNNRDFSFSYEPSELLEQRGAHHHHHQYARNPFDGMMEEDEGGFGTSATSSNGRRRPSLSNHRTATGGSSSAASSLGGSGGHQPMRSQSGGHVSGTVTGTGHLLHGLRHTSSDGQLSHSSSSNLSSIGSTHSYSAGSLNHRRSTGRIKTSSSGDHYLAGHNHHAEDGMSSEAMALGTSLDDPTSSSFMSWRKSSSAGLMGLGGTTTEAFGGRSGFEDGMPAFFADDVDDSLDQADNVSVAGSVSTFSGGIRRSGIAVGRSGSRPESGSDQDTTTGQGQGQDSNDADLSIIQMADGSSKNVSSTHVHEITA